TNHPYRGGTHTPDLQIFTPVYDDESLIAYTGSIAHHINIGGSKSGDATDNAILFEESGLLPSVLLWERGSENRELLRLLAANVRDPDSTQGDLAAQAAACRRGGERLVELCRRDTRAAVQAAMDEVLELTSRRVETELRQWPTGRVELE